MKTRAQNLEKGINSLIGSKDAGDFVSSLYNHGLINSLYRGNYATAPKKELPSYIPSRNFALAVLDLVKNSPDDAALPANVRTAMGALISAAGDDADKLLKSVEDWYNSAMDRVSGWYKRRTQAITFMLGIILAIGANADCIGYTKRLSTDASLRQSVVAYAEAAAKTDPTANANGTPTQKITTAITQLNGIDLPIGWKGVQWDDTTGNVQRIFGWLLTALAVSLGAPFWFDMLNKIMVIRSTVKPHEKSSEESSKDPKKPQANSTT